MSKKAFLVGVNNFSSNIPSLRGCLNDVHDMQELLSEPYFNFDEIKIIKNSDATQQAIRDGLTWLTTGCQPNDVRVFHFASHGTQVPSQSDPTEEDDGLDEVLVPHDHDWNNPLRDKHLYEIFKAIPPTVNFTFFADCCHSGSIQKGPEENGIDFVTRYLPPPLAIAQEIDLIKREAASITKPRPSNDKSVTPFSIVDAEQNFLLAACASWQSTLDAKVGSAFRGVFTWALTQVIRDAQGNLTYRELITRASDKLKLYVQIPQLECPPSSADKPLFGF